MKAFYRNFTAVSSAALVLLASGCTMLSGERSLTDDDTDGSIGITGKLATRLTSTDLSHIYISATDSPYGYAGNGTSYATAETTASYGTYENPCTTREQLEAAISAGGIIYISGMIEWTAGCTYKVDGYTSVKGTTSGTMIPTSAGGSTTDLDDFVNTVTTTLNSNDSTTYPYVFSTYAEYKDAYVNLCRTSSDDKTSLLKSTGTGNETAMNQTLWRLSNTYKKITQLTISSGNVTLIGLGSSSGIRGAAITIGNSKYTAVENVIIRNLTIEDAYDPFPHHEEGDGYNAQWDDVTVCYVVNNLWIDHCTFMDTMSIAHVMTHGTTEEKWQVYDGLLDTKGLVDNITYSRNRFINHDKTSLIGSSESETVNGTEVENYNRHITLDHNLYYNCGQRLPYARNCMVDITNNYFEYSKGHYTQQYAIKLGYRSRANLENNYFGSGINFALKEDSTDGKGVDSYVFVSGNDEECKHKIADSTFTVLTVSYTTRAVELTDTHRLDDLDDAENVPDSVIENSGPGCTVIVR